MKVRQLIGLLSELSDQEVEVEINDSEFDLSSIFAVYQEERNLPVILSNFKPPSDAIIHYLHLLYTQDKP